MRYYLGLIVDWFLLLLVDIAACGFVGLALYNTLKIKGIPLYIILVVCFIGILIFAYFFCFEVVEEEDDYETTDEKDEKKVIASAGAAVEMNRTVNIEHKDIIEENNTTGAASAIPEENKLEKTKIFNRGELTEQTKEKEEDKKEEYPFPII